MIYDFLLEFRIRIARDRLMRYPTRANAQKFSNLIRSRSDKQVARMECRLTQSLQSKYFND